MCQEWETFVIIYGSEIGDISYIVWVRSSGGYFLFSLGQDSGVVGDISHILWVRR